MITTLILTALIEAGLWFAHCQQENAARTLARRVNRMRVR